MIKIMIKCPLTKSARFVEARMGALIMATDDRVGLWSYAEALLRSTAGPGQQKVEPPILPAVLCRSPRGSGDITRVRIHHQLQKLRTCDLKIILRFSTLGRIKERTIVVR